MFRRSLQSPRGPHIQTRGLLRASLDPLVRQNPSVGFWRRCGNVAKLSPIVSQYVENLSIDWLDAHQDIIRSYVRGRHGIYALYKGDKLYYVGLAKNLRTRLKSHLRDRHHRAWDRFSVYLTINDSHMKELESLVLRIVPTPGNRVRGKFAKAQSLKKELEQEIRRKHRAQMDALFGRQPTRRVAPRESTIMLRATFKGKTYRARLRPDGRVRYAGAYYSSVSAAGRAVVGRGVNGQAFWKFERAPGDWIPIGQRRKQAPRPRSNGTRKGMPLRAEYKGTVYKAVMRPDGQVVYQGVVYTSVSAAGRAVVNRPVNGRWFWMREHRGTWVRLRDL